MLFIFFFLTNVLNECECFSDFIYVYICMAESSQVMSLLNRQSTMLLFQSGRASGCMTLMHVAVAQTGGWVHSTSK